MSGTDTRSQHRTNGAQLHIAALGSSFAAGPGIDPMEDPLAGRSARNYPHLLAGRLGARLSDLTVSGATTATILRDEQLAIDQVTRFPPQIDGLPADAAIVTVTAGGNDLRFIGSLLYTALRRTQPGSLFLGYLRQEFGGGIPRPRPDDVAATAQGLVDIVGEVRRRAPRARVLLVDYLTVLMPDTGDPWFSHEEADALRDIQDRLAEAFRSAAERSAAELIRASELSRGHGVDAAEPWVSGLMTDAATFGGSFHPNQAGMEAVAGAILTHLNEDRVR